jgi:pilus assembly protein CpaE
MLSQHPGGLSLIAAPNRPAEMRSFDANLVAHLLDLVASHFDHVVIDMPRTWFPWTDDVLAGSDAVYVVTEMTVPGLRHAQRLVTAISERLSGGNKPRVVVNRFEDRVMGVGLKRADVEAALGQAFVGTIPNEYRLVREAIDRGVPLHEVKEQNAVTNDLRKILFPVTTKTTGPAKGLAGSLPFLKMFAKGA